MSNIKQVAIKAAKESGAVILELSRKKIKYQMKSKHDVVTVADFKAEEIVLDAIKKNFPAHSVLSEEAGKNLKKSDYLWVIDPLDGTINYSRGLDEYCVSIALDYKKDTILGIVYKPTSKELFIAERGKGVYLNNKKIKVSAESKIINTMVATDGSHNIIFGRRHFEILGGLTKHVRSARSFGSAALHMTYVGAGRLDMYFKTKHNYWDHAAGSLIIREAGGRVTDFEGNNYHQHSKNIVASNGKLHNQYLKILNKLK